MKHLVLFENFNTAKIGELNVRIFRRGEWEKFMEYANDLSDKIRYKVSFSLQNDTIFDMYTNRLGPIYYINDKYSLQFRDGVKSFCGLDDKQLPTDFVLKDLGLNDEDITPESMEYAFFKGITPNWDSMNQDERSSVKDMWQMGLI